MKKNQIFSIALSLFMGAFAVCASACGGDGTGGAGGAAGGAGEEAGGAESESEGGIPGGPQEIVDLDDEEAPLGNIDLEENEEGRNMVGLISMVGISLMALLVIIITVLRARARAKE